MNKERFEIRKAETHSFPTIWIKERDNFGVDPRNWSCLSSYFPTKLFSNQLNYLTTLVDIISADSNLELRANTFFSE